jgi:hypothetical protein
MAEQLVPTRNQSRMVFFWASHEPERKDHRMSKIPETVPMHSSGWVAQVWISFVAAVGVTMMGSNH